ncbi:MAG: hypothetical protein WKH64_10835 [Chloroflexia bacterium]
MNDEAAELKRKAVDEGRQQAQDEIEAFRRELAEMRRELQRARARSPQRRTLYDRPRRLFASWRPG